MQNILEIIFKIVFDLTSSTEKGESLVVVGKKNDHETSIGLKLQI